jgi:hypothetical protein
MKKNLVYSMGALGLCLAAGCAAVGPPKSGAKCNNGANNTCVIEVSVPANSCSSDEIKLEEVVQLDPASKFVEWRLSTGYVFCQKDGDGAFLKPDSPGKDGFKPVGNPNCTGSFTWKREKADSLAYKYGLVFRSKDKARSCTKDPWVLN